jgi:hypothetical protein
MQQQRAETILHLHKDSAMETWYEMLTVDLVHEINIIKLPIKPRHQSSLSTPLVHGTNWLICGVSNTT